MLHFPEDADDPQGGPGSRKRAKEVHDVDWRPEDIDATGGGETAHGGCSAERAI
ncbi:hypothetical protein ABZS86_11030 [Streptomyces sp. NPDC005355]|uniref:hypothetical protein n=1 Tax=Streptomyces sp. NPDC005355 TaxID=3157038 RepID=UPI0033A31668